MRSSALESLILCMFQEIATKRRDCMYLPYFGLKLPALVLNWCRTGVVIEKIGVTDQKTLGTLLL